MLKNVLQSAQISLDFAGRQGKLPQSPYLSKIKFS